MNLYIQCILILTVWGCRSLYAEELGTTGARHICFWLDIFVSASICKYKKTSSLQSSETVLSPKVEECICCDIEILNTSPPQAEAATLRGPGPVNTLPSAGSQSSASSSAPSCVAAQADYCPQSAMLLCKGPPVQQVMCFTNKSYFPFSVEDVSKQQEVTLGEIKSRLKLSEDESCIVEYGYISNNSLQV